MRAWNTTKSYLLSHPDHTAAIVTREGTFVITFRPNTQTNPRGVAFTSTDFDNEPSGWLKRRFLGKV